MGHRRRSVHSGRGGAVVDLKGQPLQYNRKDSLLNPEFIALADPAYKQIWLNVLQESL